MFLLPKGERKNILILHWIALPCSLQGIKNSANCLREIHPHCIFGHAWPRPMHGAGMVSETDGPPGSVVTSSRANRALLQNHDILAAARASEALGVNLSAEFHAEIQTMNMPGPLCFHERSGARDRRREVAAASSAQLIMDPSQSPYNHPEAVIPHCWSTFSQSLAPRTHTHKLKAAQPCAVAGWAIIVCSVQLHLKRRRPRAAGGIK